MCVIKWYKGNNICYKWFTVTSSTQDKAKLLEQTSIKGNNTSSQSIFKLLNPSFQGLNRLFALSFENTTDRTVHTKYCLPTVEIKEYVMIDGLNVFLQSAKNNSRTWYLKNYDWSRRWLHN